MLRRFSHPVMNTYVFFPIFMHKEYPNAWTGPAQSAVESLRLVQDSNPGRDRRLCKAVPK